MPELGKPKELSGGRTSVRAAGLRGSKGPIAATIALIVLAAVLWAVSGCIPTP